MSISFLSEPAPECAIARVLADRVRESSRDLARAWLKGITEREGFDPKRPPSAEAVDDMPLLIEGIAWHLEHPNDEINGDSAAAKKAMALGKQRHAQGYGAKDILAEYEILGGILFRYLAHAVGDVDPSYDRANAFVCGCQLFHAIMAIETATTSHFLRLAEARVAEREERLQGFNRAVSHEIKNRIGAVMNAGGLLSMGDKVPSEERAHFTDIIVRNAQDMKLTLDNLLVLARLEDDPSEHRYVRLRDIVSDVVKQTAGSAHASHVDLKVDDLPDVEVDDAAVRLALTNYVCNGIKYSDSAAEHPYVEISAVIKERDDDVEGIIVRVADNGIGVPPDKREGLFHRFFRAHTDGAHHPGTGLGLSIVRASVNAIHGHAWVEFPEKGSVFSFVVPFRRPNLLAWPAQQPVRKRDEECDDTAA